MKILALTRDPEEWRPVSEVAEQEGWTLFWAHDSRHASSLIERHHISIALCDRDLPNEDWRAAVSQLGKTQWPVCILLVTSVADDYLWQEIVRQGGFDLLTKPFEPERVVKAVRFASRAGR